MKEQVFKLTEQQIIAMKKKHWECAMARNRLTFMLLQHSEDSDDSWFNSDQFKKFEEEYEDAYVDECLFRAGLVDLILGKHVDNLSCYFDNDGLLHVCA